MFGWVDFWVRVRLWVNFFSFYSKGRNFWWVSGKTMRDKMIVTPNLRGVNHILVLELKFGGYLGKWLICLGFR